MLGRGMWIVTVEMVKRGGDGGLFLVKVVYHI